ncbi:SGNH/GDSL hydrolase family protein [Microbispora hainanensis]|uniref:SGNH/GDSL hydrolase family protein n=1 Tax=Microbispora hainanensis TaxID=568844 RepID=A0ABZ1T395_9ACTN|nr:MULTISPECIES: SGNH/GDSL hydrolase family protein [Microbispora]NJP23492.1 SGNH/GDSL hydrolase family protein [Microbispora sp. CL1-1]TQS15726.1 SGNH/GDSL hydrolase family protein [Microbispora sp. SCL1-1]
MARPAHRLTMAALALAVSGVTVALPMAPVHAESLTAARTATATPSAVRGLAAAAAPRRTAAPRPGDDSRAQHRLVGAWTTATDRISAALGGQTIRMVVRASVGGTGMRLRLSNLFGAAPVTFADVHVGVQAYGAEIIAGTNRPVTFRKRTSVKVPPGQAVWSDPIPGRVAGGSALVVSLHLPGTVRGVTGHERAYSTTYLSEPGDFAAEESGEGFTYTSTQWYFLDRIAVEAGATTIGSVVAFGDSITDGTGQAVDANRRWTDYLRQRLARQSQSRRLGVLNAGIAGNRLLHSNVGPSGVSRFYRDALSQPGVRTVVIYEGINDISRGEYTSIKPLVYGYKRLVQAAHARKVKVLVATLTPFYGFGTWTPEREELRQRLNTWIRTSKMFDGVLDFDRAVRDPDFPEQLAVPYDSGDHLHLSDAGRLALADAVNLRML